MMELVESNNILSDKQSGLRKNHSCETSLNCDLISLKEKIEEHKIIIVVSLDLKRAFETIDRELFLKKCEKYGFDSNTVKWFDSHLNGRMQQTKIGENFSKKQKIKVGIPQGTVLSCGLFILYVNDICNQTNFSKISLFADDTMMSVACDNLKDGVDKMNHDLDRISSWLCANRLDLNVKKLKLLS
jgi:hypothetical protein